MKILTKIGGTLSSFFETSRSERRGILVLVPLLAVGAVFFHGHRTAVADRRLQQTADSILSADVATGPVAAVDDHLTQLFPFDPNTVTIEELCALGLELRVAASVVKYRGAGKRFTSPEDLAMCYGVTLEDYLRLEPYIVIGETLGNNRPDTRRWDSPARQTTRQAAVSIGTDTPFDPNMLDGAGFEALGFSAAQARTIINYRNSMGGFPSAEAFGRCYAVSGEALEALRPFMVFGLHGNGADGHTTGDVAPGPDTIRADSGTSNVSATVPDESPGYRAGPKPKVEINTADSALLRSVSGIGEATVMRIIEYRERLGGFARAEQLAEVKGMTEANYERIIQQITVDSCKISKIDINFAPHKELASRLEKHPYADSKMIRKILSTRQLKGGWSNTRELVSDKIWSEEDAVRMAPYFVFNSFNNND